MPGTATCGPFSEGGIFTRADGSRCRRAAPSDRRFRRHHLSEDGWLLQLQRAGGFAAPQRPVAGRAAGLHLRQIARRFVEPVRAGVSDRRRADARRSQPSICATTLWSAIATLPFATLLRATNRLDQTAGRSSGITRFATGLPVTLYNNTDSSLLGSMPNGINNNGVDTPSYTPGNLADQHRSGATGSAAFNTSLFQRARAGTLGNARRRFFYGPGIGELRHGAAERSAR